MGPLHTEGVGVEVPVPREAYEVDTLQRHPLQGALGSEGRDTAHGGEPAEFIVSNVQSKVGQLHGPGQGREVHSAHFDPVKPVGSGDQGVVQDTLQEVRIDDRERDRVRHADEHDEGRHQSSHDERRPTS